MCKIAHREKKMRRIRNLPTPGPFVLRGAQPNGHNQTRNSTMTTATATKGIKCGDCKKASPEVTIPDYTVIQGSGHCTTCLYAPECEACGAHSVADGVDIKGSGVKLCGKCRKLMNATIIQTSTPQAAPKVAAPSRVTQAVKVRKLLARMAV